MSVYAPVKSNIGCVVFKDHFTDKDFYYVRYMDDILILTKTRWQNRKAVKQLNQILNKLKVEKHVLRYRQLYTHKEGQTLSN